MHRALALVLALLVAGCASSDAPAGDTSDDHMDDHGDGHPHPSPPGQPDLPTPEFTPTVWQLATWNQSVLDELPTEGVHGGFTLAAQAAREVIPFENEGLADRYGDLVLYEVWWEQVADEVASTHREFFLLRSDLHIGALLEDRHSMERVRALFAEFAANVTGADGDTIADRADAFVATQKLIDSGERPDGTPFRLFGYDVDVGNDLRVGELIDEIDLKEGLVERDQRTALELAGPTWRFAFWVPSVTGVRIQESEEIVVSITATARGEVLLVRAATERLDDEGIRDLAANVFEALELGEPSYDEWRMQDVDPNTFYGDVNGTR